LASIVAAARTPGRAGGDLTIRGGASVELRLLCGFDLRAAGQRMRLPLSGQRVVAFLALHDQPVQRLYVAGSLWLDAPEERASARLRTALWRLRQPQCCIVEATTTHLSLAPDIAVDVRDAVAAARRALRVGMLPDDPEVEELCLAGELLPDWYEDWVLIERERFRVLRLEALEAIAAELAGAGRFAAAAETALAAVAGEPLRESAHRVLIGVHIAQGNWFDALRQYRFYRDLVRNQLGLEPSPEMEQLVQPLRPQ
jgi:DNA-binding SARP family transcriptional activator